MSGNKKDALFELIKSLTPGEKRYFTKYAKRHELGNGNDYLWLFQQIDKQEKLNWEAIEKKMPDDMFKSGIYKARSRLSAYILKSMRSYNDEATPENQIMSLLVEADFLRKKEVYSLFKKKITEAKSIALNYQKIDYLPPIYEAEFFLHFNGHHDLSHDELTREKLQTLEKLKLSSICHNKTHQCGSILNRTKENWSEEEVKIIDKQLSFLSKIKAKEVSFNAFINITTVESMYHSKILKNFDKAADAGEKCIQQYLANRHMIEVRPSNFLATYHNALLGYLMVKSYERFKKLIQIPKQLKLDKGWTQQLNLISTPFLLNYYLRVNDLKNAEKVVTAFEKITRSNYYGHWDKMLEHQYLLNGFYYLIKKNYNACMHSIDQLFELKERKVVGLEVIGLFLYCICLHELNEIDLLDSSINKMKYFIQSKIDQSDPLPKALLKLTITLAESNKKEEVEKFWKKYQHLKKKEKNTMHYIFDLDSLLKPLPYFS